jgi:hypothetical protein
MGRALVVEVYYACSRVQGPFDTVWGARRAPGPTYKRARSTKQEPTSIPTPDCMIHRDAPELHPTGSCARAMGNLQRALWAYARSFRLAVQREPRRQRTPSSVTRVGLCNNARSNFAMPSMARAAPGWCTPRGKWLLTVENPFLPGRGMLRQERFPGGRFA